MTPAARLALLFSLVACGPARDLAGPDAPGSVVCQGGPDDCPGPNPCADDHCGGFLCGPDDGACTPCTSHDQCAAVCDEGRCLSDDELVFVAPNADPEAWACTRVEPCRDLEAAAARAFGVRRTIVMAPGRYAGTSLVWRVPSEVHVLALGAEVVPLDGPAIDVRDGAVLIEGGVFRGTVACDGVGGVDRPALALVGAGVSSTDAAIDVTACDVTLEGVGVSFAEVGVTAHAGAAIDVRVSTIEDVDVGLLLDGGVLKGKGLAITRARGVGISVVSGAVALDGAHIADGAGLGVATTTTAADLRLHAAEIVGNRGGGLELVAGHYAIVSSLIAENGDGATSVGGLSIGDARGVVDFSTIVNNRGLLTTRMTGWPPTRVASVEPSLRCALGQAITASIVDDGRLGDEEPANGCALAASVWLDDPAAPPRCDPSFVDVNPLTVERDYHLGPGSTCVDQVLAATSESDLDGDARPLGRAADYGADESR